MFRKSSRCKSDQSQFLSEFFGLLSKYWIWNYWKRNEWKLMKRSTDNMASAVYLLREKKIKNLPKVWRASQTFYPRSDNMKFNGYNHLPNLDRGFWMRGCMACGPRRVVEEMGLYLWTFSPAGLVLYHNHPWAVWNCSVILLVHLFVGAWCL